MSKEIKAESDGQAAGRDIVHQERNVVHVNFGANYGGQQFIANEPVHFHMAPATPRPKVKIVIQPGPDCIDEAQKTHLKTLVAEVIRLEGLIRRTPKSFGSVWTAVNTKCKASSYHLITQTTYPKAEKFLREWIGRLSSTKSAHVKDPAWRNGRYRYIHAAAKEIGRVSDLPALLAEKYSAQSMKDLSDHDLEAVYQTVAGWKKQARRNGVI